MKNKQLIKQWVWRIIFYVVGIVVLAAGITLNTKTGLGVSPIISIPFAVSMIWNTNFAVMTFIVYSVLVGIQFVLKGKNREWKDILQIPFSFIFSFLLDLFGRLLPFEYNRLWQNLLLLAAAIILTAIGAAMTVNVELVPNPADGLTSTVGAVLKKGMGFGKNLVDIISVALTCIISFVAAGEITAVGLGTVIAMIGVGRVIAVFNYYLKEPMIRRSGL